MSRKVFDYENNTEWNFKGEHPCIIDFYADWCGPCKMVSPIMEELSKEFEDLVDVYKINTEEETELAQLFGIKSIPSVLFCPLGEKPRMAIGALPKEGYIEAIDEVLHVKKV